MKIVALVLASTVAVAGRARLALPNWGLSTQLAPSEVEWERKNGPNTVSGLAVVTVGGASHTCARQSGPA